MILTKATAFRLMHNDRQLDTTVRDSQPFLSAISAHGILLPGNIWLPHTSPRYGKRPTPVGETSVFGTAFNHLGDVVPAKAMSPVLAGTGRVNMTRIAVIHRTDNAAGNIAISTNGTGSNQVGWRLTNSTAQPSIISTVIAVLSTASEGIAVGEWAIVGITGRDNGTGTTWEHWRNGRKLNSDTSTASLLDSSDPSVGGDDTSSTVCAKDNVGIPLHLAWDGPLTDSEMQRYTTNPWAKFATRKIWIPVSVATGGTTYTFNVSGGVAFNGGAPQIRTRVQQPSGGVTFSGAAAQSRVRVQAPSGGITFSGNAPQVRERSFIPSGLVTFGGSASLSANAQYIFAVSGGLNLSGTAPMVKEDTVIPSGSVEFGGSAKLIFIPVGGPTSTQPNRISTGLSRVIGLS